MEFGGLGRGSARGRNLFGISLKRKKEKKEKKAQKEKKRGGLFF